MKHAKNAGGQRWNEKYTQGFSERDTEEIRLCLEVTNKMLLGFSRAAMIKQKNILTLSKWKKIVFPVWFLPRQTQSFPKFYSKSLARQQFEETIFHFSPLATELPYISPISSQPP